MSQAALKQLPPDAPFFDERKLILTVALIQFFNVMDFMMVMPLGPDFAAALKIPVNDIGMIGGSYAFSAAIAGLIASFVMDNYARKKVILVMLAGLSIATLGGAIAWSRESMLGARLLAGLFGGPLTSASLAVIADYVPPHRRGAAMGKVMGGFSAATVLGVPFGLELASRTSWHTPFIVTALLGVGILMYAINNLPYQPAFANNLQLRHHLRAMRDLLKRRQVVLSYILVALSMAAAFVLIPNIAAHLQMNWHYPRAQLSWLYFGGGVVTFFTMRGAGVLVDRTSATQVSIISTVLFITVLLFGFVFYPNPMPVIVIFIGFMMAMTTRNICAQAAFSKIPPPNYRGAYTSLQMSLTHLVQAIAAWASSFVLIEENGMLLHMNELGWIAVALSVPIPILFYYIETHQKTVH